MRHAGIGTRLAVATIAAAGLWPGSAAAVLGGRDDPGPMARRSVMVLDSRGGVCSGVVLARDVVLTAAHCVTEAAAYRVVAVDRGFRPLAVRAIAVATHPAFLPGTTPRTQPGVDLAILRLEAPLGPDFRRPPRATVGEIVEAVRKSFWALTLPPFVLGGMYMGIFTATEAAATGALYALVVAAFIYRTLTLALFFECVLNAARTTAMLLLIVVGAGVFGHMLTVLRIPQQIVELVSHLDLSVYVFLAAVTVILILLGLVLESLSIILITTPIIVPVLVHLGIDKVWYGILLTITLEMALISPPVALNLVVIKSLTKAPSTEIDKAAVPYLILMLLAIILLVAFPDIAMWLPRTISNAGQ